MAVRIYILSCKNASWFQLRSTKIIRLQNQYKFSPNRVTVTQGLHISGTLFSLSQVINIPLVCANLGAMFGGALIGWASQIFGRRLSIMACCVVGGALLYPYTFVSNNGIIAAAFFEQAMVQGAWGVIPIQ